MSRVRRVTTTSMSLALVLVCSLGFTPQTPSWSQDPAPTAKVTPPIALSVVAGVTMVDAAWLPNPRSPVRTDGYVVYWWPAAEGLTALKAVSPTPQPTTVARITNVPPDTEIVVTVRAATKEALAGLERVGDWWLSGYGDFVIVRTRPDVEAVLEGGTSERVVLTIKKYHPAKNEWTAIKGVATVGKSVGGVTVTRIGTDRASHGVPGSTQLRPVMQGDNVLKDRDGDLCLVPLPTRGRPALVLFADLTDGSGRTWRVVRTTPR